MSLWNVYVGTFTKAFATESEYVLRGRDGPSPRSPRNASENRDDRGDHVEVVEYSEGIEHFRFDDVDGTLRHVEAIGDLANPQYLTTHPTLPVIYTTEWARTGRLIGFTVGPDGTLDRRSTTETLGELAIAVSVHPSGNFAYVAHWGDGALTACRLDGDGTVVTAEPIVCGDRRGYFERAHHHHVRVTPNGRALLVTDVGADEVIAYELADDGSVVSPRPIAAVALPANSKPRHLEFHPSGRLVYVAGEWDSTLHVLAAEEGVPSGVVAGYSTMPRDYEGKNVKNAELHLHPDGRTLFVANRSSHTVTVFAVDDSGGVESLGHQSSQGRGPSTLRVDPTGQYLLVGNTFSGTIAVFRIDDDRRLYPIGAPVAAPAPRAFAFVEVAAP